MKTLPRSAFYTAASLLAMLPTAQAQQPLTPRIGYVFPAGARQGETLEVQVGGQFLQGAASVHVTGADVQASVSAYDRPLTQREVITLRDKLDEARKKLEGTVGGLRGGLRNPATALRVAREAGITDEQVRKLLEFQRSRNDPKKQLNPQIAETVTLQVRVGAGAAPGVRELRLVTPAGLTNPLRFEVGTLPERTESEPNDRTADVLAADALPAVLNGRIMPGDVDRFTFSARKGARLVAAVRARKLVPYLADAVPGWFQATLTLYDAKGREVGYADDFRFDPDPVLACVLPADGAYTLEIKDALYRGREDFVYRIEVGEIPFVTGVFPLGGREGVTATVALQGWNLPESRLKVEAAGRRPGACAVSVRRGDTVSNSVPFAVDTLPERAEQEPNSRSAQAQRVALPCIVNGRIEKPGDADVFRIEGRAGNEIVAEVCARRLNSPLDSTLTLTAATGRSVAANDDTEDRGTGLLTHHADSRLAVRLPVSGTYFLTIRDAQRRGGAEYAYRLRIGPPQPDFALRVVPSSVSARAGESVPITVFALRRDGMGGDIALELKDAPPGFVLSGGRIPAGADKARLTLTVPALRQDAPVRLAMEGQAVIAGREICRAAVPAEDMMQAFAYRHLVPAEDWMVMVGGRRLFGPMMRPPTGKPVQIPAGGTARVRLTGYGGPPANPPRLSLSDPPEGITLQEATVDRNGITLILSAEAGKTKLGLKGNLLLDAFREMTPPAGTGTRRAGTRRMPLGTLPAIPFEIVPPRNDR